jgi:Tol biopolymer transport system component
MDWRLEERNLFIYDLDTRRSRRAYNADHKMGPLAAWSPDGKKIVYTYLDNLWVMNSTGIGRGLLDLSDHIHKPVTDAALIGFSRDGEHVLYQARGDSTLYVVALAQRL